MKENIGAGIESPRPWGLVDAVVGRARGTGSQGIDGQGCQVQNWA